MRDTIANCLVLLCVAAAPAAAAAQGRAGCAFEDLGGGTVRAVLDGRTLMLADGREVRLAAIEVPGDGRAALQALIGSGEVSLKHVGPAAADRYGRVPAHAFVAGDRPWLQRELVASGLARVAGRVGDAACSALLLGAERAAREAGRGLWAEPAYAPRRADDPAALLAERGRFTLVEGSVVSVRESGGVIYVNFGRRWSEDFTATVLRRNERAFRAAGVDLKALAGRNVRIRGVIEERGGPWIEIERPEQIEMNRN